VGKDLYKRGQPERQQQNMPFSHHSHSGQFCGHARDTLEQVITHAIHTRKMRTLALTEHMPRGSDVDLYPEEVEAGLSVAGLWTQFGAYYEEASRLRRRFDADGKQGKHGCEILLGFEIEWIRGPQSAELVRQVLRHADWNFDFFVGSVHHVHGVPIDFDAEMYAEALNMCEGGEEEEALFSDYFDAQYEMLCTLKPKVVGHFDLIRLLSKEPDRMLKGWGTGRVWEKVVRNLEMVRTYGGLLELNSSALRKGLREPYPRREICQVWRDMGGGFVMSDDSHGVGQVGTCYPQLLQWIRDVGLRELKYLTKNGGDEVFVGGISVVDLEKEPFWAT